MELVAGFVVIALVAAALSTYGYWSERRKAKPSDRMTYEDLLRIHDPRGRHHEQSDLPLVRSG
jgi:hypothetical protein